jgi:hypothetical protein
MFLDFRSRCGSLAWATLAGSALLVAAPAAGQEAEVEPAETAPPASAVTAEPEREAVTESTPTASAQPEADAEEGPETSFTISLNQDIFFGFYGTAAGAVELAPGISFTAYTILWTTPSFSASGSGGDGLWTEFGAGVSFSVLEDRLTINPQVGILNGVLLSGSQRGLAFEGIVPNLTANYRDDLFQAQIYAGYYLGLREENPVGARDFLHYWANAGLRPTSFLGLGLHWEQLVQTRGTGPGVDGNLYMWVGAYGELAAGPFALRFTAGVDVVDAETELRDFYKVNVAATF